MFFFEKKNQKTFTHFDPTRWQHAYRRGKSFLRLVFKKEVLSALV